MALARGEAISPSLAGRSFRAADWYVRMDGHTPSEVVNEWYRWMRFDDTGRSDPAGTEPRNSTEDTAPNNVDPSALPTPEERALIYQTLFMRRQDVS